MTNFIALCITLIGYSIPVYGNLLFMTGSFALSGAITNWIAIYMLFDKVPYLYGSGIIPNRFNEFKEGIKKLIMNEFFTKKSISKFSTDIQKNLTNEIDLDDIFNSFLDVVEKSQIGSMLSMIGGKDVLLPIKKPMLDNLKQLITGKKPDNNTINLILSKIEEVIDKRLIELTPTQVKDIIQEMIRKHLGWLVVWGGVFGGLIGFIVTLLGDYQ